MTNEGYKIDRLNQWPHRLVDWLKNGLFTKFSAITGRMNEDGVVHPCNEPVLVYKERTTVSQTSTTPVVAFTLANFLGEDTSVYKNYYIDLYAQFIAGNDAVEGDNLNISMYEGAAAVESVGCDDFGHWSTTRTQPPGNIPRRFFPNAASTTIRIDHLQWGATETHTSGFIIMVYRMPGSICT